MRRQITLLTSLLLTLACGGDGGNGNGNGDGGPGDGDGGGNGSDASTSAPKFAELWYSVDDRLVYIPLNTANGTAGTFVSSTITNPPPLGQNMLTMLDDGSLVGARLSESDNLTHFYHIGVPPRDGSDVSVTELGVMPGALMLEGLYTDCDGRLYGMDTGTDVTNANGNRLIRFTGNVLAGDFANIEISDLATADVADIDDMGPGITDNKITDNPGLAIDTGTVHDFNYETGSGTEVGSGGTFGIHALGPQLFDDNTARLYVLNSSAELYEMDPGAFTLSGVLGTGPTDVGGGGIGPGWTGLAGPLTDCDTGFTPIE